MQPKSGFRSGKLRLHLGCGEIYLKDYVNIDIYREGYCFLAKDRSDLVEKNRTTVDDYYKNAQSKESIQRKADEGRYCVADRFISICELDYPENSVDEIRLVQVFEHLTRKEADLALSLWYKILKPEGELYIDVPDFEETAQQLLAQKTEEDKEWYYRLIFGSQKDEYSFHKDGFSFAKLKKMLEHHGFRNVKRLSNTPHFYPAVIAECQK